MREHSTDVDRFEHLAAPATARVVAKPRSPVGSREMRVALVGEQKLRLQPAATSDFGPQLVAAMSTIRYDTAGG